VTDSVDSGRRPWRGRDAVLALIAGFVASVIAYLAVAPTPTTLVLFAVVFPAQWAGTFAFLAWLAPRRADWRTELRVSIVRSDFWGIIQGAFIQLVLASIAFIIVEAFFDGSAPTQDVVVTAGTAIGPIEVVLVVLGLGVVGPITEEVVFRGVLLRVLEPRGRRPAIVLSSLVFAGVHLLDPGAILAVPFLFVLGLILAKRTLDTGRLGGAMALHAGFNLITVAAVLSA
jgi:membrane protease YdiL (CAAX protease family)